MTEPGTKTARSMKDISKLSKHSIYMSLFCLIVITYKDFKQSEKQAVEVDKEVQESKSIC